MATPTTADTRSGVVFVPRLGLRVAGSGEGTVDCSGSACSMDAQSTDYDDKSDFMLEFDVLAHLSSKFRLGGGFLLVPTVKGEFDTDDDDTELGRSTALLLIGEGVFGGDVAGTVRGFAGLDILFPGGDLEDQIDDLQAICDALDEGVTCKVDEGPYVGYTLGLGGGVLAKVGDGVSLRGDAVLQYISLPGASVEVSGGGLTGESTTHLSGTRFWLSGGLEF